MNRPTFRVRSVIASVLISFVALLNAGCAAVLVLGAVPIVGGFLPGKSKVTIDQTSVDPKLRELLSDAKKLGFIGAEEFDIHLGRYLETKGGYEVALEPAQNIAAIPSKRRKLMQQICSRASRPDLVFSASATEAEAGAGTIVTGLLLGRIRFDGTSYYEVMRCRNQWTSQFAIHFDINQGRFNPDESNMSKLLGEGFAQTLLELAGRAYSPPPWQR